MPAVLVCSRCLRHGAAATHCHNGLFGSNAAHVCHKTSDGKADKSLFNLLITTSVDFSRALKCKLATIPAPTQKGESTLFPPSIDSRAVPCFETLISHQSKECCAASLGIATPVAICQSLPFDKGGTSHADGQLSD
jgi:hypothetical protein